MFKSIINKTFALLVADQNNDYLPEKCNYSYILKKKEVDFEKFTFTIRYLLDANNKCWIVGTDFAQGLRYHDPVYALKRFVAEDYKQSIHELVFRQNDDDDDEDDQHGSCVCINQSGAIQLVNQLHLDNKIGLITWLIKDFFPSICNKTTNNHDNDLLNRILIHVESLKTDNEQFKMSNEQFKLAYEQRFNDIEQRLNTMDSKLCSIDTVDTLYDKLRDHHRRIKHNLMPESLMDGGERTTSDYSEDQYGNVRFTRDITKHPHLGVVVKALNDGHVAGKPRTQISFITGQGDYYIQKKRKLDESHGELIYDSIHANPQMEIHRINEELQSKNYNIAKRTKRSVIVECTVPTAKSFINECVM